MTGGGGFGDAARPALGDAEVGGAVPPRAGGPNDCGDMFGAGESKIKSATACDVCFMSSNRSSFGAVNRTFPGVGLLIPPAPEPLPLPPSAPEPDVDGSETGPVEPGAPPPVGSHALRVGLGEEMERDGPIEPGAAPLPFARDCTGCCDWDDGLTATVDDGGPPLICIGIPTAAEILVPAPTAVGVAEPVPGMLTNEYENENGEADGPPEPPGEMLEFEEMDDTDDARDRDGALITRLEVPNGGRIAFGPPPLPPPPPPFG